MTGERLLAFLENPAEMAGVSYQEMKTLTLNYPYSASLRVLLLLKSEQEKHWEKGYNLAMASVYAPDRSRIFCLMSPKMGMVKVAETVSAPIEAVLELKPLAAAEQEIAARKAAEAGLEQNAAPAPAKAAEAKVFFEKKPEALDERPASLGERPTVVQPAKQTAAQPETVGRLEELAGKSTPAQMVQFSPKAFVFSDWYGQFVLPVLPKKAARISLKTIDSQLVIAPKPVPEVVETVRPVAAKKAEKPVPKKDDTATDPEKEREDAVKKLVKRSVKEKDEIASETLAKLYARQGYKDKAAAMYRKLMVVFPEKSATFAAEIEKLGR